MIVAEKVYVKVGEKLILEDVSIQLANGEVTAIMGPNGAGKSTLLKCLTGVSPFDSGAISINGVPLGAYSLEDLSRMRAVLSQSTPVEFPFTALEIVTMGRTPFAEISSPLQDDDIACQALNCLDSLAIKDRIFPTLSGGEQQRVQLARVIAQLWGEKRGYLFLDEPTSALDLKHQHQVLKLVRNLAENKNIGIIIVMHDLNLALRYADNVVLLKNGRLFASGDKCKVLTTKNIEEVFEVSVDSIFYKKSLL